MTRIFICSICGKWFTDEEYKSRTGQFPHKPSCLYCKEKDSIKAVLVNQAELHKFIKTPTYRDGVIKFALASKEDLINLSKTRFSL